MLFWEAAVLNMLSLLQSPLGIVAMLVVVAMSVGAILRPRLRLLMIGVALFAGTVVVQYNTKLALFDQPLIGPLVILQTYSRLLTFGMIAGLMLAALLSPRLTDKPLPWFPFALAALMGLSSVIRGVFTDDNRMIFEIPVILVTFTVLAWALPRWLVNPQDIRGPLIMIGGMLAAFVVANLIQLSVNRAPTFLTGNDRFRGITTNPNFFGAVIVAGFPALLYLIHEKSVSFYIRVVALITISFCIIMVLSTGSRGPVWTAAACVLVFYRFRFGRFAFAGLGVAIVIYLSIGLFSNELIGANRVLDTQNSRATVWAGQWERFMSSPMLGIGISRGVIDFGENSHLAVAASFGVMGLIPLGIFLVGCGWLMVKLMYACRLKSQYQNGYNACLAAMFGILMSSVFEATLLGVFSTQVYTLLIYIAVGTHALYCHGRELNGDTQAQSETGDLAEFDQSTSYEREFEPVGV